MSVTAHASVPPPVFLIKRVFAEGLAVPWVAVKDSVEGLRLIVGGAVTVTETGTVTVLALVARRVRVVVWVPIARLPVTAVNVMVLLPVPEGGLIFSHEAFSLAVQARLPPPVLLMFRDLEAGLPLPCCTVNEMLVGLVPIAGGEGMVVMVKVIGMVTAGVPGAFTVIAAV